MRKRAHRVVYVDGVMCAVGDGGARLLIGGVSVSDGDDEAGPARRVNARHRAQEFRGQCQNLSVALSGFDEFIEQFGGREFQEFRRMHAAADGIDKRPFEMNAEDFGAAIFRAMLARNVAGDAFHAFADGFGAGGNSSGNERSCAVCSKHAGHRPQRVFGGFHDVMTASAVNVHIEETGGGDFVRSDDFLCASGQGDRAARPDGLDDTVAK